MNGVPGNDLSVWPLVSYILLRSLLNKWPEADPDMLELSTEKKRERQSQKDCFVRPDHR